MPLPKRVSYTGLKDFEYLIRDTDAISRDYFNIVEFPSRFTAGKNLFKLKAQINNLVDQSEIYIEILDFNGDPVYYEPLQYVEKDGTRVVSVYIYPDTAPGIATVYLAGRARVDVVTNTTIPFSRDINSENYFNIPNVLWQRTITIAPTARNNTEIIFTQYPSITVSEVVQPYLQPVDLLNVFTTVTASGGSLTITPAPFQYLGGPTPESALEGGGSPGTPTNGLQFYDIEILNNSLTNSGGTTADAPPLYTLYGSSKLTTVNFPLSASMIGGIIEIVNPNIIPTGTPNNNGIGPIFKTDGVYVYPFSQASDFGQFFGQAPVNQVVPLSGSYRFAITNVISSTEARVSQYSGFRNPDDNTFGPWSVKLVTDVGSSANITSISTTTNFTASFTQPIVTIQTERSSSFADLILSNIEPATGDVFRIKTLYKPTGFFGDFIDLGDTILEQADLLLDTDTLEQNISVGVAYENFGIFENLAEITTYWTGSTLGSMPDNPFTLAYDTDTIIGGVRFNIDYSPINGLQTVASLTDAAIFQIKPQYYPEVTKGTEYIVRFTIATDPNIASYSNNSADIPNPRMDVYISGSQITVQDQFRLVSVGEIETVPNFNNTVTGNFRDLGPLGTRIGTYQTTASPGVRANVEFRFIATENAPVDLKFVFRNGTFILGNIRLLANKETGFSPNYARIFKRVPTEHLNTPLTFKFQYYDYEGKQADLISLVYGVIFDGDNTVIQGVNNLLTGSLFISDTVGTGIELAGTNSGFIRNVGFRGYTNALAGTGSGFIMYSGSVLPNETSDYVNGGFGFETFTSPNNYIRIGLDSRGAETFIIKTPYITIDGTDPSNNTITIKPTTAYKIVSASYTITSTDEIIEVIQGETTQSLPSAVGLLGAQFSIINVSTGSILLKASGSQTIGNMNSGNSNSLTLYTEDAARIVSNNTNWRII